MPEVPEPRRRERILDAAEHAFDEYGFAGASLRHMVREARVNLATVYYYFGSKQGLMEAVLKRRFGPLREHQLEQLRQALRAARNRPASVGEILKALLLPPLEMVGAAPAKRQAIARLIGRIVTEPDPKTQDILRRQNQKVREEFLAALQESLPGVAARDLRWRLEFVTGAMAFILCNPRKLEHETHGECDPVDVAKVLAEMIRFFTPGFRADSET